MMKLGSNWLNIQWCNKKLGVIKIYFEILVNIFVSEFPEFKTSFSKKSACCWSKTTRSTIQNHI